MKHRTHPIYKLLIAFIFLFLIGYALFNARFLISGPKLTVDQLNTATMTITTDNRDFTLTGVAKFASYITLNGLAILVNEEGLFKEKVLLSEEFTKVKMIARDKFGKEEKRDITIVYTGDRKEMEFDEIITELFRQNKTSVEVLPSSSEVSGGVESGGGPASQEVD